MNYPQLLGKMRNQTINIIDNGHQINVDYLCERLESKHERLKKKPEGDPFLKFFENDNIIQGEWLLDLTDHYCECCQSSLVFVLTDGEELLCTSFENYYNIRENSIEKDDYLFKKEDSTVCIGFHLQNTDKLVSKINVPTGELVIQNFFRNDEISEKKERYSTPNICSILGREVLMHELSEKNIGYGQTGNMSLEIYSNDKEILLIDSIIGCYSSNIRNLEKNPESFDETELKTIEEQGKMLEYLKENHFTKKGKVVCEMRRWQCADKAILDSYNEIPDSDAVILDIPTGNYTIEHYYDFGDSLLVSKITLA